MSTMRYPQIAPGEYYHIFNRGISKQNIFLDVRDYARFLFFILHFQALATIHNPGYHVTKFMALWESYKFGGGRESHMRFGSVSQSTVKEIVSERGVELVAFCIMPNHFHACVKEANEGGIARLMQRSLMGYTKYFQTKYNVTGHVFQGQYKAVHVEDNKQLLHLSAYIHRNPRELPRWKNREHTYPWSSCQDYLGENRWGELLVPDIVLGQFKNQQEYQHFLNTSPAKE